MPSWATPTYTRATGYLVTAANWNEIAQDLAYLADASVDQDLFLGVTSGTPVYKAMSPATNLLTNAAKNIAQRGDGPDTITSGNTEYTLDRVLITVSGGDSVTWERVSDETYNGMAYSLKIEYTKSSGGTVIRQHLLPAYEMPFIPIQLSYRAKVKCSTNGGVLAYISDNVDHEEHSSTNSGTGWQSLDVTSLMNFSTTEIDVGFIPQASCTIWIGWECLTGFTSPSDYQPMNTAEEFLRCQRYYEIIGGTSGGVYFNVYTAATGDIGQTISFNTHKAAASPTVTKHGTWDTVAGGSTGQPSINATPSQHGFSLKAAVGSATGHYNGFSTPDNTTYIEAYCNP